MRRIGTGFGRKAVSACASAMLAASLMPAPALAAASLGAATADLTAGAPAAGDVHYTPGSYEAGEILVEYDNASDSGVMRGMGFGTMSAALAREVGIDVVDTVIEADEKTGTVVKAATPDGMSVEDAVKAARALPGVAAAQPNFRYGLVDGWDEGDANAYRELVGLDGSDGGYAAQTVEGTNDKYLTRQYYLGSWEEEHGVGAIDAWEWARCEGEVTIAVVDTGCAVNHLDLADQVLTDFMWDAYSETRPGTIVSSNVPIGDNDGHGTHVCGIAAATADNRIGIAGASYNANILPVKVFDNSTSNPGAETETIVKAYKYIMDLKDDTTLSAEQQAKIDGLHLINMSLGGYGAADSEDDQMLEKYIEDLREDYDVLTVCAGGNGNRDGTPRTDEMYPSDFDACFSVTATNADGANVKWSDYNDAKDISAPGYDIYSTYPEQSEDPTEQSCFTSLNGTSMASPLVAGCAALLWAAYPGVSVDEVVAAIQSTANKIDPNTENYSERVGNTGSPGVIDIEAAVQKVMEESDGVRRVRMKSCEVAAIPDQVHTGRAVQPRLNVTYQDEAGETVALEQGKDYSLDYRNNKAVGKATVTVIGRNKFIGRTSSTFNIKYDIGVTSVNPRQTSYDFSGDPVEAKVNVTHMSRALMEGVDYTVAYRDNDAPGTGVVIVNGIGEKYMNQAEVTFEIVDKRPSLAAATVGSIKAQAYTGNEVKPSPSVRMGAQSLVEGRDYKVDYIDNVKPGFAVARLKGIGSYGGEKLVAFRIDANLKATSISKAKGKKGSLSLKWTKIPSKSGGYEVMYSTNAKFKGAKSVKVAGASKGGVTLKKLKAKTKYFVKVRAYGDVGGVTLHSAWSAVKSVKTK